MAQTPLQGNRNQKFKCFCVFCPILVVNPDRSQSHQRSQNQSKEQQTESQPHLKASLRLIDASREAEKPNQAKVRPMEENGQIAGKSLNAIERKQRGVDLWSQERL